MLQIEELSIHSQDDKTRSNKAPVISKTSSARRVFHLERKALKEHKEMQTRLEKLEREAKELEREIRENEIADLQEEVARKARTVGKEIEMAKVSSSWGSSLRSIFTNSHPGTQKSKMKQKKN